MQADGLDATLLHTEGFGLNAQIEVSGQRLYVLDTFSEPGAPKRPGPLGRAELPADDFGGSSWAEMFAGNPSRKKGLVHVGGGRYLGYGEIVGLRPTVTDVGVFAFEVGPATSDARCLGAFILLKPLQLTCHLAC